MKAFFTLIGVLLLLAVGGRLGIWWSDQAAHTEAQNSSAEKVVATGDEKGEPLYWYDPMVPQQHFDRPGKSPFMDMELIPKYASQSDTDPSLKIDANLSQMLGMRQVVAERIPLTNAIEATGILGFNERDVTIEQMRADSFVERVWPLSPGDLIAAGQPLAELMVPAWVAAQHEFLAVRTTSNEALVDATRDRLRLLGMSAESMRELEETGKVKSTFVVRSSRAGLLQSLDVRSGMTLTAGQTLARINGLGTLWLEVAVSESLAQAVRPGARAEIRLASFPGKTRIGQVARILPTLADSSRSLQVRVELPNSDGQLRPGMSAQVTLSSGENESAVAVPTEAIIRTGMRSVVILAKDGGRYLPVEVTLGREVGAKTIVEAGLQEGEKVVSSGQFLIDSEASLSGFLERSKPTAPEQEHKGDHP